MDIFKVFKKELCEPNLRSRKKKPVIEDIASIIKRHRDSADIPEEAIAEALLERERLGSTGFGGGLAIPHCKLPGLDNFLMGIAISKRGVNFDAMDNRKVHLFCIIVGPEDRPEEHVKLLAEVSLILSDEAVRRELIAARTQTALYEEFLRHCPSELLPKTPEDNKLLMLVVQGEDELTRIMEVFVEMGVRGASIIESGGMANILSRVPLFADFMNFLGSRAEFHRTVFAIVPTEELDELIRRIETITGDMNKHTGATAVAFDIAFLKGSMESV